MARAGFDFTDKTYSGEERLADLLALSRGTTVAWRILLQHIKSYTELIEDDVRDRPDAAEYLRQSQKTMERMLSWMKTVEQTVQGVPETEKLDVRPLVEGMVQRCRRIVSGDLSLQMELDGDPAIIDVAMFQIQDVLLALLENVVERCRVSDCPVCVRVNKVQLGKNDIALLHSSCAPGLYVVLTMGNGDCAFQVGEQRGFWDGLLHDEREDSDAELMLLHAYGVVLGYGGDLVFGPRTEDSSLYVLLPLQAKRKEMQVEPNIDDEGLYGSETILLVDDEDMIWDVIIDMLQELGYSVILAGNGLEAVEIYRENPGLIDLVMLDMVMPELDGHGAFFKLKEIDPDVRVLLSSGYVSEDDARDVLDAGAVGFLQKPYRMVDLARIMRSIFDGSG